MVRTMFVCNLDLFTGGPWCYVETDIDDVYEKDYCDIPFCDDGDCMFFTKAEFSKHITYTHFTNMNGSLQNFSFSVKSWEPDHFLEAEIRVVLAAMSIPCTSSELHNLGIGVEVLISNNGL